MYTNADNIKIIKIKKKILHVFRGFNFKKKHILQFLLESCEGADKMYVKLNILYKASTYELSN